MICWSSKIRVSSRLIRESADYPLHLGLTEAGLGMKGIVASTAGLAILLDQGIGDTIRVSLTPSPGGEREEEVRVAQQVLQSMGLRSFLPQVSACPGCGRTTSTFFQEMAERIQAYLRDRMPEWRETHPGVEELTVAVMGCVVNGPGESKHAEHRDQPARHVRGPGRAGLRRRPAGPDAPRRGPRRRVHRPPRGLRRAPLSAASERPSRPDPLIDGPRPRVYTPRRIETAASWTWVTPTYFFRRGTNRRR